MGQKVNPNIFRLGINKTWKTKFFEKKPQELSLYTFRDLEIKNYVERFLEKHGLILHDYKQHHSNSTLNLYISYFVTSDFNLNQQHNQKLILTNKFGEKKCIKSGTQNTTNTSVANVNMSNEFVNSMHFYKIRKYLKTSRYKSFQNLTNDQVFLTVDNNLQINVNNVFDKLFKVLSRFTGNELNIVINLCCINKDLYFLKFSQIKKFSLFQKFRNASFVKEGIEILFHVVYNDNSANLLARFIVIQLKRIKRQKLFFSFLKQSLSVFINSNFSKSKGIKIIVKGRLNGVPRAKHKIINVGDVPVQSIKEKLDYSQTTVHNSSGSYGIKVWVVSR